MNPRVVIFMKFIPILDLRIKTQLMADDKGGMMQLSRNVLKGDRAWRKYFSL